MPTVRPFPEPTLHNSARVIVDDPLTIETPTAQWAYAAQFRVGPPEGALQVEVAVEIEVSRGEIGVGLLKIDGSDFYVERHVSDEDGRRTVKVALGLDQPTNTLVLRNVGSLGTAAVVTVHNLSVTVAEHAAGVPGGSRSRVRGPRSRYSIVG